MSDDKACLALWTKGTEQLLLFSGVLSQKRVSDSRSHLVSNVIKHYSATLGLVQAA
jgi:hypothetical protein